jgi:hypothetical protein
VLDRTSPPRPEPACATPCASPRRRSNHWTSIVCEERRTYAVSDVYGVGWVAYFFQKDVLLQGLVVLEVVGIIASSVSKVV